MKKISILFLSSFITLTGFAQELNSAYIDSVVNHAMETMPHAGIAVAVIKEGKIIHSKGYGTASIKLGTEVNENTVFSIASNSKAFTTMALGLLVDQGKLRWTDKVVDYIPEFKMYDAYVTANFTIIDLLTHRSGLGLGAGDLMFIPSGGDFTIDDIITSFQYQKPVSAFRTKYDYDNLLYMVAGEVINRLSGMSWDSFVETQIMKPLNMDNSAAFYYNLKDKSNVAEAHRVEDGNLIELIGYEENRSIGAAGGIYSSVNDLSKWMLLHLNKGITRDSTTFISSKSHREMWKAHTNIAFNATPPPPYKSHYTAYGLGWKLSDKNGYTTVSHTGGMPGMLSHVVLLPELNSGVVVLTNCDPGGYSFISVTRSIEDLLIGVKPADWVGRMENYINNSGSFSDSVVNDVWEIVEKANTKHLNMEDYQGTYVDPWFGEVVIEDREGQLWFSCKRSPKLTGKMYFYQANTFAIKWEYRDMECDAFALFSLDENGLAQSIKMKGIAPNIDFSYDFHHLDLKRKIDE